MAEENTNNDDKIVVEFDYQILKGGEPLDDCYATVEFTAEQVEEMVQELMEQNSTGELTDLPEKYLNMFVDAALDDAEVIYPNFSDEKVKFAIVLQRFLPEDLLDYIPEEVIENFDPDMFELVAPNPDTSPND